MASKDPKPTRQKPHAYTVYPAPEVGRLAEHQDPLSASKYKKTHYTAILSVLAILLALATFYLLEHQATGRY